MIIPLAKNKAIPTIPSSKTIQKECKPTLQQITKKLVKEYKKEICSIYIYGSFSEGRGILKKSDLDLFVVTTHKIDFSKVSKELTEEYKDAFLDVTIVTATKEIVLQKIYDWLAFTKLFCVCIYGEDLAKNAPPYYVSNALIYGFIEDTDVLLKKYQRSKSPLQRKRLTKLLIRRLYSATLDQHYQWTTILEEQTKVISRVHPTHKKLFTKMLAYVKENQILTQRDMNTAINLTKDIVITRQKELKKHPLKLLFGIARTGETTEKVIKEIREELKSRWMN